MKKFKMMLPMLAFVFAMVGAVAGDFLPGITAYYKLDLVNCSTAKVTVEDNCQIDQPVSRPICTISDAGNSFAAYKNPDCSGLLRQAQTE